MYISTKTYGHEVGLSCAFREWRAQSRRRFLHGYALAVRLEFEADEVDTLNWVVDFGSLKSFREMLGAKFDHKTLVAKDDPQWAVFQEMHQTGLIQMVEVPATSCKAFAQLIFEFGETWLRDNNYIPRVRMRAVEVREQGGESARVSR